MEISVVSVYLSFRRGLLAEGAFSQQDIDRVFEATQSFDKTLFLLEEMRSKESYKNLSTIDSREAIITRYLEKYNTKETFPEIQLIYPLL